MRYSSDGIYVRRRKGKWRVWLIYEREPYGTGEGLDIRGNLTVGAATVDEGQPETLAAVVDGTLREAARIGIEWDTPALVAEMTALDDEQAGLVKAEAARLGWRYERKEPPPPLTSSGRLARWRQVEGGAHGAGGLARPGQIPPH